MSKWTTVRVDKETAERLRAMAGDKSVSSLLEEFSKPVDIERTYSEARAVGLAHAAKINRGEAAVDSMPSLPPAPRVTPEVSRTQPVAKESPFEARAHKRKEQPKYATNEFGDDTYDD